MKPGPNVDRRTCLLGAGVCLTVLAAGYGLLLASVPERRIAITLMYLAIVAMFTWGIWRRQVAEKREAAARLRAQARALRAEAPWGRALRVMCGVLVVVVILARRR
jgi:chromate transport protein ChrA